MTIRLRDVPLGLDEPESELPVKAAARIGLAPEAVAHLQVARRSLDARRRRVRFIYTVDLGLRSVRDETAAVEAGLASLVEKPAVMTLDRGREEIRGRVVVAGCGPAGLFAALKLAEYGCEPLLIERGAPVEERREAVARFHSTRELDRDSNLLFGAGGAGTYSDGKLRTRLRDSRIRQILETLVSAGAPQEVLVDARPHLGTDRLHGIMSSLCGLLMERGGEIRWRTRLTGLDAEGGVLRGVATSGGKIETNCLVLATGGSARDTFQRLFDDGLPMEAKPFQMGVRVEHPRDLIDREIFGKLAGHPRLGAAEYVLSAEGATSFCVCPGGVLVAACAEPEAVCTNGMSNSAREGAFTNCALITTVPPREFGTAPLAGIEFQRKWEREAFQLAGADYAAPAQAVPDFLSGTVRAVPRRTTYALGVRPADLRRVVPQLVGAAIASALPRFEKRIRGFTSDAALMVGPETRASCPVRILRDPERRTSVSMDGVYPAGEGSGYSSGIMSSAVDGMRSAEAVIERFA